MTGTVADFQQYLEKRILVQLNGSRKVMGILRGYDVYLNIVLDEALEEKPGGEKVRIGMVVIRGNAVVMLEVRKSTNYHKRIVADLAIRHSTASTQTIIEAADSTRPRVISLSKRASQMNELAATRLLGDMQNAGCVRRLGK